MIPFITEYRFGSDQEAVKGTAVYVDYRAFGKYTIVNDYNEVLNRDGEWEWEPSPSNRDDDFLQRTRFDLKEALTLAEKKYLSGNTKS